MEQKQPKERHLPSQLQAENEQGGTVMAPPAFSLTASGDGGNGDKTKDGKPKNPTPEAPKPALPETRVENGPLASKDVNDQHAFDQNDVRQGQVEDCWFMAAVASIAKSHPDKLADLIQDNGDGKYTVTLHFPESDEADAKWVPKQVQVDNNFPVNKKGNLQAGRPGDNNEIWVMLLEKAYYQEMGGVNKVARSLTSDGFSMLTGNGGHTSMIRNGPADKAKDAKKAKRVEERHTRKTERIERRQERHPGLAAGLLAEPETGLDVMRIPEYELLPYLQGLLDSRAAVTISTSGWEGGRTFSGFRIYAPHVYSIESIDLEGNTISLLEPSGGYNLENLPLKLFRKHFDEISYLNL